MNQPASKTLRRRFLVALGHAIRVTWPVLSAILAFQLALGLLTGFVEGWSLGDAVYFTFITGLTQAEAPQAAGDQQEQADGRHPQSG